MHEYTRGAVSLRVLYIGVLPPRECSIEFFPGRFLFDPSKFYLLQEKVKFSTHKGVVQVYLVFRADFVSPRSLEDRLL